MNEWMFVVHRLGNGNLIEENEEDVYGRPGRWYQQQHTAYLARLMSFYFQRKYKHWLSRFGYIGGAYLRCILRFIYKTICCPYTTSLILLLILIIIVIILASSSFFLSFSHPCTHLLLPLTRVFWPQWDDPNWCFLFLLPSYNFLVELVELVSFKNGPNLYPFYLAHTTQHNTTQMKLLIFVKTHIAIRYLLSSLHLILPTTKASS